MARSARVGAGNVVPVIIFAELFCTDTNRNIQRMDYRRRNLFSKQFETEQCVVLHAFLMWLMSQLICRQTTVFTDVDNLDASFVACWDSSTVLLGTPSVICAWYIDYFISCLVRQILRII